VAQTGHRTRSVIALIVGALVAVGAYQLRRHLITGFFVRTSPALEHAPALPSRPAADLEPSKRVRVVVIDGLGRRAADALPALSRWCDRGLDLVVDVGFPTVSLPVETVLWTGLTQEQAGIRYVLGRLDPIPEAALPARVPNSFAISDRHPYLVHSFGFAESEPAGDKLTPEQAAAWQGRFEAIATDAMASPRPLVFVHLGRVDVAGHRHGGASPEYATAADQADALADRLLAAAGPDARLFVLSDHGHLPGGGHAGIEDSIRLVRGCIVGPGIARGHGRAHLVDLAHSLFASLAVPPPPGAAGRPILEVASGRIALGSTLPTPPPWWRFLLAAALLAVGTLVTGRLARRWWSWPTWFVLAYLAVIAMRGWPSLSMPVIYPPQGRDLYVAGVPGLCVLAMVMARGWRSQPLWQLLVIQLALPGAAAAALFVLAGGIESLVHGTPALVPHYTAQLSVVLVLTYAGALVAVLAGLVRGALSWFDRDSDAGPRRTGS